MVTAPPQRPRKGRHRAPSRWGLYRSSHADRSGNLVSLLIPAWRETPGSRGPRTGRPAHPSARPSVPIPPARPGTNREPVSVEPPPAPPVEPHPLLTKTGREPIVIPHHSNGWRPASVDLEVITPPTPPAPPLPDSEPVEVATQSADPPLEPPEGPFHGPPTPRPAPTPVVLGPIVDLRRREDTTPPAPEVRPAPRPVPTPPPTAPGRDVAVTVDRSVVLPPAREERGTFANMLGFGEDEAYYGPIASISLDAPSDRQELVAHAYAVPMLPPEEVPEPVWDTLPGLSDVHADEATSTNELIGRLWEVTETQPILDAVDIPAPQEPSRVLVGAKRWRWSMIGGLLVAIVLVFVAGSSVGQRPIEEANQRSADYLQSVQRLSVALGPIDGVVDGIAGIGVPLEVGPLVASLDAFDGVARDVAEVSAEPLPEPAFLGSSVEIDRLDRPQELLQRAASTAATVERRLGNALAYRLSFGDAFQLPDLPVLLAPEEVGQLGTDLSVMLASTRAILDGLPDDAFFERHHQDAVALLEALEEDHIEYLDALRREDPARAGIIRREMVIAIEDIRAELDEPMTAMSTWATEQLDGLRGLIGVIDDAIRG